MRTRLTEAAVATALMATAAMAADAGRGGPPGSPAPNTAISWMGSYLGNGLGYRLARGNSGADPAGITGSGQPGYNRQARPFVSGVETGLFSNSGDTFANYKFSNPWFGTARGRGRALDNILFDGTLGLAYGRGQVAAAGVTQNDLHTGGAAGSGREVGLAYNWSAEAAYLYIDFGSGTDHPVASSSGLSSSVVRSGVNL